jgi:hypothetical protein
VARFVFLPIIQNFVFGTILWPLSHPHHPSFTHRAPEQSVVPSPFPLAQWSPSPPIMTSSPLPPPRLPTSSAPTTAPHLPTTASVKRPHRITGREIGRWATDLEVRKSRPEERSQTAEAATGQRRVCARAHPRRPEPAHLARPWPSAPRAAEYQRRAWAMRWARGSRWWVSAASARSWRQKPARGRARMRRSSSCAWQRLRLRVMGQWKSSGGAGVFSSSSVRPLLAAAREYLLAFSPKVTGLRNFAPSFPRLLIYKATPFFGHQNRQVWQRQYNSTKWLRPPVACSAVFRQFADIVAILRIYGGDFENLYMVGDET